VNEMRVNIRSVDHFIAVVCECNRVFYDGWHFVTYPLLSTLIQNGNIDCTISVDNNEAGVDIGHVSLVLTLI
jgi:hypothetical protein